MFLEFYNLREQPFGTTPNPRYLYSSIVHREALASLVYGIESNLGFAVLVAEPGMGKTTLLFRLLSQLKNSARTAFLFETQCDSQSLLRHLLAELRIPTTDRDPVVLHEKFKQVLYEESRIGRRVVVIIDEAQNLETRVLETVRLLSNFETSEAKLLHIILAGQPRLAEQLGRPELSQVRQRIPIMSFLRPLELEEVAQYIDHRLRIAGYSGPQLFTTSALEGIAELSGGVPREINRICFNALSLGCALEVKQIHTPLIDEVGADLDLNLLLKNVKSRRSVSVRDAVSVPDTIRWHAAAETSIGAAPCKDTRSQQASADLPGYRRTHLSTAADKNLPGPSTVQCDEDVQQAWAYIQDFLRRNKPVITTPQN